MQKWFPKLTDFFIKNAHHLTNKEMRKQIIDIFGIDYSEDAIKLKRYNLGLKAPRARLPKHKPLK